VDQDVDQVESTSDFSEYGWIEAVGVYEAGHQYNVRFAPAEGGTPVGAVWPEWAYELAKDALLQGKPVRVMGSPGQGSIARLWILSKLPTPT
jgi:hypothetical protein